MPILSSGEYRKTKKFKHKSSIMNPDGFAGYFKDNYSLSNTIRPYVGGSLSVRGVSTDYKSLCTLLSGEMTERNSRRYKGWSLLFTVGKSISIAYNFSDKSDRKLIEKSLREAHVAAMQVIEEGVYFGHRGVDNRIRRLYTRTLIHFSFIHTLNKRGQPHFHIHTIVPNITEYEGRYLCIHKYTFSQTYREANKVFDEILRLKLEANGFRTIDVKGYSENSNQSGTWEIETAMPSNNRYDFIPEKSCFDKERYITDLRKRNRQFRQLPPCKYPTSFRKASRLNISKPPYIHACIEDLFKSLKRAPDKPSKIRNTSHWYSHRQQRHKTQANNIQQHYEPHLYPHTEKAQSILLKCPQPLSRAPPKIDC